MPSCCWPRAACQQGVGQSYRAFLIYLLKYSIMVGLLVALISTIVCFCLVINWLLYLTAVLLYWQYDIPLPTDTEPCSWSNLVNSRLCEHWRTFDITYLGSCQSKNHDKIASLCCHCHSNTAPSYITDMLQKIPPHSINTLSSSHTMPLLNTPVHSKQKFCDQLFSFTSIWKRYTNL